MKGKCFLILLVAFVSGIGASAQLSYADARVRADRFFGFREWASASALYNYMLHQNPEAVDTYGRAIVCNSMLNDSIRAMDLLTQAMAYNIPLDSVLTNVQKYSFEVGKCNLYEKFMLQAARENPWLARPIDNYLLRYYAFRNDGAKMVEYAQIMLKGTPDNTKFMQTLAKGYMLEGETPKALDVWKSILTIDPNNIMALLCLANYYNTENDRASALAYFGKAYELSPTPYVGKAIAKLEGGRAK